MRSSASRDDSTDERLAERRTDDAIDAHEAAAEVHGDGPGDRPLFLPFLRISDNRGTTDTRTPSRSTIFRGSIGMTAPVSTIALTVVLRILDSSPYPRSKTARSPGFSRVGVGDDLTHVPSLCPRPTRTPTFERWHMFERSVVHGQLRLSGADADTSGWIPRSVRPLSAPTATPQARGLDAARGGTDPPSPTRAAPPRP